jgi:molybdenum cofactor cytidylyltransferase
VIVSGRYEGTFQARSMAPRDQIGALVLAAGRGQRFGGDKLMSSFRGRPLVSHVLEVVQTSMASGVVAAACAVVPAGDEPLNRLALRWGLLPVPNPEPALGISQSLRLGLTALSDSWGERLGAAVILLGDQPLVKLEVIGALAEAWRNRQGRFIRPRYFASPDEPGHPVLLDRSLWLAAEAIRGDVGLGTFQRPGEPGVILLDLPGENPDIDTPHDLRALEGRAS